MLGGRRRIDWSRDPEYRIYFEAWLNYHRACVQFDRQIAPPNGIPEDEETLEKSRYNYAAMKAKYLTPIRIGAMEKWEAAKRDAASALTKELVFHEQKKAR